MSPTPQPGTQLIRIAVICVLLPALAHSQDTPADHQTLIYKRIGDRELKVDVFRPAGDTGDADRSTRRPAIAFFHGGGWVFGDRAVYHDACRRYAARGFVTLSFEYRLSRNPDGSYPHPHITPVHSVMDARSAIRWIRRSAHTLGVHPDRIAAWGRSAGGQLVWAAALFDDINEPTDDPTVSPIPNALLSFSACYNTVHTWMDHILGDDRPRIWDISPHHRLKKRHPPAIGFHGRNDTTEPWRVANWFHEKATKLGAPFELVTLDNEGHALSDHPDPPGEMHNPVILQRADTFLRKTLTPDQP